MANNDISKKIERIPMKGIRKISAQHLYKAHITAVHVTHIDEADMTDLVALRIKKKKIAEKKRVHLTFMPFIIKALIESLKKHPLVNSSIEGEDIIVKKYYNISIAVDTEEGLVVPVVKNADSKDIFQLSAEIQSLAEKARGKKISLDELKDGTITITNFGSIGGKYSTPMLNYPQTAVVGLGRIEDRPVTRKGKIVTRKIMPICLTYDHRAIDGAKIARFINDLKELLENPENFAIYN